MKIAFIGLGVMGYPMAGHLQRAGHAVCVYNRTAQRARQWVAEYGGACAATPGEAAAGAQLAFTCVGDDNDVRAVVSAEQGVLAGLPAGAVLVDHTTASAELARELQREAHRRDVGFIDAPVSGGQAGAENGSLTVMAGGSRDDFERVAAVLQHYARCVRLLGPTGSGQLAKMVNQVCIAGIVQGLAEGLAFSERAGLDSAAVVEVIAQGAAQSWQMENRGRTMTRGEFEFGFAVNWMRKDLNICLAEANRNGARLPVTALVDQFYATVQARGGGRYDTSALIHLLMND